MVGYLGFQAPVIWPGVQITTLTLPQANAGTPYSTSIAVNGGALPLNFSLTVFPAGMSINSSGVISWANPTGTSANVTVLVTDQNGSLASMAYTLTVVSAGGLAIATLTMPVATVGSAYGLQFVGGGGSGNYTWILGAMVPNWGNWASITPAGFLSGTPTQVVNATTSPAFETVPIQLKDNVTLQVVGSTYQLIVNPS